MCRLSSVQPELSESVTRPVFPPLHVSSEPVHALSVTFVLDSRDSTPPTDWSAAQADK